MDQSHEPYLYFQSKLTGILKPKDNMGRGMCQYRGLCLNHAEFFLADLVIAAVFDDLIHRILGDIHKCDLLFNADLADGIAGNVRMKGDLANDVTWAHVIILALVDLQSHHAFFMHITARLFPELTFAGAKIALASGFTAFIAL